MEHKELIPLYMQTMALAKEADKIRVQLLDICHRISIRMFPELKPFDYEAAKFIDSMKQTLKKRS